MEKEAALPQTQRVEILTESYRVLGNLVTGPRRLSDVLNQAELPFLTLLGASATPLENAEYPPSRQTIHVSLESVRIAIPRGGEPTLEERQRFAPFTYVEKEIHEVNVYLPPFRVTGYLPIEAGLDLAQGLARISARFLPVTNALVVLIKSPDVHWTGETIIIDARWSEILWPGDAV